MGSSGKSSHPQMYSKYEAIWGYMRLLLLKGGQKEGVRERRREGRIKEGEMEGGKVKI